MVPGCPSSTQAVSLSPQEYKELKGDGPFTIFVPHADLMTNLSQVTQPLEQGWGFWGVGAAWAEVEVRAPLCPHDSHSRMSWPGFVPIASLCSAITWLVAGSCEAKSC